MTKYSPTTLFRGIGSQMLKQAFDKAGWQGRGREGQGGCVFFVCRCYNKKKFRTGLTIIKSCSYYVTDKEQLHHVL